MGLRFVALQDHYPALCGIAQDNDPVLCAMHTHRLIILRYVALRRIMSLRYVALRSRGSQFLNFNFLQFAIDGKNNSNTKVEKVFFLIFHVFLCGNEFLKIKNH
jgi:hypothetical protein